MYFSKLSDNNIYIDIVKVCEKYKFDPKKLPVSHKILLENIVRCSSETKIEEFFRYEKGEIDNLEIDYYPERILMQDMTGVPAIVDLAMLREEAADPKKVNPCVAVDLVIDHSIQVDSYGSEDSLKINLKLENDRNEERYKFLKWASKSFNNLKVIPPGQGICHQVNLEYLSSILRKKGKLYVPDTLIGLDSHTTMAGALSQLAWGVGGIEAEARLLGIPISLILPRTLGVKLFGKLNPTITATDLVLYLTSLLRKEKVVGDFIEFYGPGLKNLTLADRATISNMSPEYGSTLSLFPLDDITMEYMRLTREGEHEILLEYMDKQFMSARYSENINFDKVIEVDLSKITQLISGPQRPEQINYLSDVRSNFKKIYTQNKTNDYGKIAIASITSCTNTSNPSLMIGAGLLARNLRRYGVIVKPWVKTSFAPGSKVVLEYLKESGLYDDFNYLGFNLVGFGCTTCIGNSGPINEELSKVSGDTVLVSILSGNRNFEGRINKDVKANYLASPMLVVLYAVFGSILVDIENEKVNGKDGKKISMKDVWPSDKEIKEYVSKFVREKIFSKEYKNILSSKREWDMIKVSGSDYYPWDKSSTYIKTPPFCSTKEYKDIISARVLLLLGDDVTTDHISPAGNIHEDSSAGLYLKKHKIDFEDFNTYGTRRGNHEVMARGTYANTRLNNLLGNNIDPGYTIFEDGEKVRIYDAAMAYIKEGRSLVVIAGENYGMGSSRDWAAKGVWMLGVKAVIAKSFERIHRSNLIYMGIVPIIFSKKYPKITYETLVDVTLKEDKKVVLKIDGKEYSATAAIYSKNEETYLKAGGILKYIKDKFKK